MSIEAELYDGTVLEFPDNTNPQVISATVKRVTAERRQKSLESYKTRDPSEYDPASPEYQAKYGATSGNNFFQNANVGVGKAFTDLTLGAKQLVGMASPEAADEKRRLDAAIMQTGGGKVGYMGGMMAAGAPVVAATGATVPGAMFAGGLLGALQPASNPVERYLNVGRDAATAGLGQYGANQLAGWAGRGVNAQGVAYDVPDNFVAPSPEVRASYAAAPSESAAQAAAAAQARAQGSAGAGTDVSVNPQVSLRQDGGYTFGEVGPDPSAGLTSTQSQIAKWGRDHGYRLTPGQASGSRALQQFEAKLESQPMTSGPFTTIRANNTRRLNEETARAIGQQSDVVDGGVLTAADDQLGKIFAAARNENSKVLIDKKAAKTIVDQIDSEVQGLLPGNATVRDHPLFQTFEGLAENNVANGKQLGQLSSKLGKAATKEFTTQGGDRDRGAALAALKDHVDDLLESTLSGKELTDYRQARVQWRNLVNITSRTGNVNPASGNVKGGNLANTLMSKDKKGYTYGKNQGDFYNSVRFAQAFAPLFGDSGTATRSALPSSSLEFLLGIPIGLATRAYASNTASAGAAAMANAAARAQSGLLPAIAAADQAAGSVGSLLPYAYPGLSSGYYGSQR